MKILVVTGCPTGIAHTFIAEEKFKRAAKELGFDIKVETHGQVGIQNKFTDEEIENCKGIVIAADKDVQSKRFVGKQVIEVSVSKGIKNAKELLQSIADDKGTILDGEKETISSDNLSDKSISRQIYKHLMNGVSHMLPFVVGGGVLIAISFLWGIFSFDPNSDQYNAFAALLKNTGGLAFSMMVPVLAAYISASIAERPGLVVGFVGGLMADHSGAGFLGGILAGFIGGYIILMLKKLFKGLPKSLEGAKPIFLYPVIGLFLMGMIMHVLVLPVANINQAMMNFISSFQNSNPIILGVIVGCMCGFDMGGPVNKAAYVTGVMLLGQGNYYFMAGVSAACMTPPFITTVAAILFKNKFDKNQLSAAYVNFILGSTHITEGAIPFAAENPIVVLPIIMFGSSISAMLTYMFKVQVPAPHGGFLVLPLVTNALLWILAISIGSIVGGVIYGKLKK